MLVGNPGLTSNPQPKETDTYAASSSFDVSKYTVQTWNGSAWVTQATVSGNKNVIRHVSFGPVSTTKVRIIPVDDASNGQTNNDNVVSLAEVEVWTTPEGGGTQVQRFDAWGNQTQSAGAAIPQYGYTGREPDATGLIYYRARYYDPSIGRFISRDPAGMPDGINRYAYVGNDPINNTDPSGEVINFLVGGGANVALGWGLAQLTGQDYSWGDAARDFTIGAATSGVGTAIKAGQIANALNRGRQAGTVIGTAQKTGTLGHVTRTNYEASKALNAGADAVYLNRAWGTAAGVKATGGLAKRPDVIVKSGPTLRGIEVGSKTDKFRALGDRLEVGAEAVMTRVPGMSAVGGADDVIAAFGQRIGSKTYGFTPLPATYGLGYALGLDTVYQGANYFSNMQGTGGSGNQTLFGVSPRN